VPNIILDLEVDRVDLVDEGANSEAFIKLYKRKETSADMDFNEILEKMKPEHAQIVKDELAKTKTEATSEVEKAKTEITTELEKAKTDLATANEEIAKMKADAEALTVELEKAKNCSECGKAKGTTETCKACGEHNKMMKSADVDEVMKSLDPSVQEVFKSLKAQKEAAEEVVKQINAKRVEEEAIAKAKDLKAIPVEEAKLVSLMKGITPEVYEVLKAANAAIENSGLLDTVGKAKGGDNNQDAWAKIEKKAEEYLTADTKLTKQMAIAKAVKENPDLYKEYLTGGAK
jgi:hypothetical protein